MQIQGSFSGYEVMKGSVAGEINFSEKHSDNNDKQLQDACADFEAIMITRMLETMKSTLNGNTLLSKDGLQKDVYDSMYNQELAENIAHGKNSLGLGEMLYRQLTGSSDPSDDQNVSSILEKRDA
jgi:Rod binding domain-containing protein